MRRSTRSALGYLSEARPATAAEIQRAYQVLGLPYGDASGLEKAYRALARQHHPDTGGDPEKMKELNWARDVIDANPVSAAFASAAHSGPVTPEQRAANAANNAARMAANLERWKAYGAEMKGALEKELPAFEKYLATVFPGVMARPLEIDRTGLNIQAQWATADGSTSFRVGISIDSTQDAGGLGAGGAPSLSVSYKTEVLHDRRTYKMAASSFAWRRGANEVLDAEKLFPKAKLAKVFAKTRAAGPMQKRDFIAALKNELSGTQGAGSPVSVKIPYGKHGSVEFVRTVMMRMPAWSFGWIRKDVAPPEGKASYAELAKHSFNTYYGRGFIAETEAGLEEIKAIVRRLNAGEDAERVAASEVARQVAQAKAATESRAVSAALGYGGAS